MGFTAWSCAALLAHFQMLTSAALRAAGMLSAIGREGRVYLVCAKLYQRERHLKHGGLGRGVVVTHQAESQANSAPPGTEGQGALTF